MAYFDSPKNKAMWEKEIARMETERERRKENGYKVEADDVKKSEDRPLVRLISFEELGRKVRMKKGLAEKENQMTERMREPRVNERNGYERDARQSGAKGIL